MRISTLKASPVIWLIIILAALFNSVSTAAEQSVGQNSSVSAFVNDGAILPKGETAEEALCVNRDCGLSRTEMSMRLRYIIPYRWRNIGPWTVF